MSKRVIGLDIETVDPLLKTAGYSWKYRQGYILCTALYHEAKDKVAVIAGIHNDNCPYDKQTREEDNRMCIEMLLRNPDVCLVGANIIYDIGWLLYEYGTSTYDVKCSFVDVLQAENLLNEFDIHTLESVSQTYLKYGKTKARIEAWVRENKSAKGDFRKYLQDAPWELLEEYVKGDAKNPVKIWRKQLTLLKEQGLCKRAKLEFDCILPTLQMTINGMPFNEGKRETNLKILEHYRDIFKEEFLAKYPVTITNKKGKSIAFKVTSSNHIAKFCDQYNIPYQYKITLKGRDDHFFSDYKSRDKAMFDARKLVSSFRFVKKEPVAYVPCALQERTCEILHEAGFIFNCSPNVDKKYFEAYRNKYEQIGLIADWKLAEGIISKILGDKFTRFISSVSTKQEGLVYVRPQYKITDTKSRRYASYQFNAQQIPSKGGFKVTENGKEIEVKFPLLTRILFVADKGCVFGKIDYGQIEYRLICNIACGESGKKVREEYAKNPHLDFHQYVVDLTGLDRKHAKNMSFGVSFGMSVKSMADNFGWTLEHAEEIAEQYHSHMPFVAPTLALVGDLAKEKGYIRTVYGSRARLANENLSYTMLNRYTQGSGAECLKLAIVKAYKEGLWEKLKPANTVHDELNFPYLEPTEESMRNFYRMADYMRNAIELRVPLEAEIELGDNWASTKTIGDWKEEKDNNTDTWLNTSAELKKSVEICLDLLARGEVTNG